MTETDKMSTRATSVASGTKRHPRGKQDLALRAATEVFLRYGYARTTMGDIATEAGISRPALYLLFPSKEAIFEAVVRAMECEWQARTRAALVDLSTVSEKLQLVCERWGLHGYEVMSRHPDAKDLFDLQFPAVQKMYASFQGLIAEIIAEAAKTAPLGATAEELARIVAFGIRGLRETVVSEADTRRLITLQVSLLVAALGLPSRPAGKKQRRASSE